MSHVHDTQLNSSHLQQYVNHKLTFLGWLWILSSKLSSKLIKKCLDLNVFKLFGNYPFLIFTLHDVLSDLQHSCISFVENQTGSVEHWGGFYFRVKHHWRPHVGKTCFWTYNFKMSAANQQLWFNEELWVIISVVRERWPRSSQWIWWHHIHFNILAL